MKIPERACRLKLDLQADTRDEMVRALEGIATSIDRSEMSTGCSGGVHSGWTYEYIQNTGPTHEQYQAQLKAYIAAKRAEKETRPAHTAAHDCACEECVKAETRSEPVEGVVRGSELERQINRARRMAIPICSVCGEPGCPDHM